MEEIKAANVLQRWVRSRQYQSLAAWPSLAVLRATYLDPSAAAAGARESELYSDVMLLERHLLRGHAMVKRALSDAWAAMLPQGATKLPRGEQR